MFAEIEQSGHRSTPEEIAEADRIIAEALAPYERKSLEERERALRNEVLRESVSPYLIDLSKPAPIVRPIIEHNGKMIASLGNISAVVGAAKSKKTFLCTALIGGLLSPQGDFGITPRTVRVLWVDTEQSLLHARKVVERIHRLAGLREDVSNPLVNALTLREIEPKERDEALRNSIELFRPAVVVIDGVSDLMYNTNDIEESDRVVGELMALSSQHNCHIICVLHTNPNSDKARGHIGSTLQRKAESVLFVHKVRDCSVVEPQFCRNEEFEAFAFCIDEEGLPTPCEMPAKQSDEPTESANEVLRMMEEHYPNGVSRVVLRNRLMEEYGLSDRTASMRILRAVRRGELREEKNDLFLGNA